MSEVVIFKKTYDAESLCDVERDISECFDPAYNMDMVDIPKDEYGFEEGSFEVKITWKSENQN